MTPLKDAPRGDPDDDDIGANAVCAFDRGVGFNSVRSILVRECNPLSAKYKLPRLQEVVPHVVKG
jgi:hypothetical protein